MKSENEIVRVWLVEAETHAVRTESVLGPTSRPRATIRRWPGRCWTLSSRAAWSVALQSRALISAWTAARASSQMSLGMSSKRSFAHCGLALSWRSMAEAVASVCWRKLIAVAMIFRLSGCVGKSAERLQGCAWIVARV